MCDVQTQREKKRGLESIDLLQAAGLTTTLKQYYSNTTNCTAVGKQTVKLLKQAKSGSEMLFDVKLFCVYAERYLNPSV